MRVPNEDQKTGLKGTDILPSEGKEEALVLISGQGFAQGAALSGLEERRCRASAATFDTFRKLAQARWTHGRRGCARKWGSERYFFCNASRCLSSLSSSSFCCAIRSAFRSSSSAPETAAACSISCRMLSRAMAIRASSSSSDSELELLMMFPKGPALSGAGEHNPD